MFALGCVAASVPLFVTLEVGGVNTLRRFGFFAAVRHRALIAVFRVEGVVYMAAKIARAVKPGSGADEDASGLPFVGRGGQLLNNMINAMGLKREQVYIANVVKCRPPQNRTPEPDEAHTCVPFLFRQIDVVRPQVIVALGQTAVTYLTGEKRSLANWRGTVHPLRGTKLIVTYHPAFLLRDPNQKKHAWADLQIAMRELGLTPPARK